MRSVGPISDMETLKQISDGDVVSGMEPNEVVKFRRFISTQDLRRKLPLDEGKMESAEKEMEAST